GEKSPCPCKWASGINPALTGSGHPDYACSEGVLPMPKFLIQARYTTKGIEGVVADSASGRKADVQAAVQALGGKLEVFYFGLGDDDVISIVDLPNTVTAAALSLTTSAHGTVRIRT